MNIYFHIDELNRDAVVASALQKKCAARGHTLIFGNRLSNRLVPYFRKAFDIIIMPRPHMLYDNWGDAWMEWEAKFVMLSTESLGIICKDHKVMARTLLERDYFEGQKKYVARIDAFCLWGRKQLSAIQEYAQDIANKCHVVGHPRQDTLCKNLKRPGRSQLSTGKKNIGIITRAVALNDYFGRSALDGFSTLLDDHFQYEYINQKTNEKLRSKRASSQPLETLVVQAIDVESTLKTIDALLRAGHAVHLRAHPKERVDSWQTLLHRSGLTAEICEPKQPIVSWLQGLDYIIGPPSTSFYDAAMLGITPISISALNSHRSGHIDELWEDNNQLMPYVYKPESIKQLLEYIDGAKQIEACNEMNRILKEESDFPDCAGSLDRVIDVCTSLVAKKESQWAYLMSFVVARKIFNILWKLRSMYIRRTENSAMFVIDKKTTRFITALSGE
jgi:surface carbohydrate biosynthesis protein